MTNAVEYPQLNDPKIAARVKGVCQDISNIMTMMESSRETIKNHINDLSDEIDVPKKLIRQMSRTFHRQTFQTEVQESDAFEISYEKVFGDDA